MVALVSPALAETLSSDGAALATRANDAAKELRIYLADVAKAGGRPDFSKPPASELFGHIFDMNGLAALPPPAPNDFSWLLNSAAGSGVIKAILTFGITPPAGPSDQAGLRRPAGGGVEFPHSHHGARSASLVDFHGATA
jgi:hypothetical protein